MLPNGMKVNRKAAKAEIHATEDVIRKCKAQRRLPPGGGPSTEESLASAYATWLCSLQAHSRGRIHLRDYWSTLEEQWKYLSAQQSKLERLCTQEQVAA